MSNLATFGQRNGSTRARTRDLDHQAFVAQSQSRYTLRNSRRYGIRGRGLCATIGIALGTTGCGVGHQLVKIVCDEFGRLPHWYKPIFVDAATKDMDVMSRDFLSLGVDGAGSVAAFGREMFLRKYRPFVDALKARFARLVELDELFPCEISKQRATAFVIFTGLGGGTSGGALEPAISGCHDAAQELGIADARVHVAAIGPEICLNDIHRNPTVEQRLLVTDNAACNLTKLLSDFANPTLTEWRRPDGTTFEMRLSERVWTINLADQSNGQFDFQTLADFNRMMARTYFLSLFTEAGKFVADRYRDDVNTGVPGRPLIRF